MDMDDDVRRFTSQDIWAALATIDDPEMPISIVDLGIVEGVQVEGACVRVAITPTFTGCPALDLVDHEIRTRLEALPGVGRVEVLHVFDPPWSAQRITAAGRARLAGHGVSVPGDRFIQLQIGERDVVSCPYCGSPRTRVDSPFGPTRCRATHYCEACHSPFERLKR
jgi:ring-1,2-phenylacetyl-CoA epoxidase subunit PaaD